MRGDRGYTFIVDALNALAEYEDVDDAREWLLADINMAENVRAALEYAADTLGADSADIGDCLQRALPEERCEVFESVLASLEAHLHETVEPEEALSAAAEQHDVSSPRRALAEAGVPFLAVTCVLPILPRWILNRCLASCVPLRHSPQRWGAYVNFESSVGVTKSEMNSRIATNRFV